MLSNARVNMKVHQGTNTVEFLIIRTPYSFVQPPFSEKMLIFIP